MKGDSEKSKLIINKRDKLLYKQYKTKHTHFKLYDWNLINTKILKPAKFLQMICDLAAEHARQA